MKRKSQLTRRVMAACVVATGIAIAWGIAIGWLGLISGSLSPTGDRAYDSLQVYVDGTPVISTTRQSGNTSIVTDQRTLDGKQWPEKKEENWLGSAYFPRPHKAPGVFEVPQPWNEGNGRVAGAIDGKSPPGVWWFVYDNERAGSAYVAGYDGISKLPIGYIGRSGFRPTKPPLEEQFIVPFDNSWDGFRYLISSGQNLEYRRLPYIYRGYSGRNVDRVVYLLGTDRLWEIDLGERSVRSWMPFDGHLAIGQLDATKKTIDQLPVQMKVTMAQLAKAEVKESREKWGKAADERAAKGEVIATSLWAIRQPDRIVFFDLWDGRQKEFILPEKLRDRRMSVFLTGPDEMLVDTHEQDEEHWDGGPIVRLLWINSQGHIQREQEVRLAGPVPVSLRTAARNFGLLVPVSVVWILGLLIGGPIALMHANMVADYPSALAYAANMVWAPMAAVLLSDLALAFLTLRQQQKYRRPGSIVWAVFVFLFGVAGYAAYFIEHRQAKLDKCAECGAVVPRDREACATCSVEFVPPARIGTEIFA